MPQLQLPSVQRAGAGEQLLLLLCPRAQASEDSCSGLSASARGTPLRLAPAPPAPPALVLAFRFWLCCIIWLCCMAAALPGVSVSVTV